MSAVIVWERHGLIQRGRVVREDDVDRTPAQHHDVLAVRPDGLRPCGTRSAAERHVCRGEVIDDACLAARRAYYRDRERARRRARAGAAS